MSDIIKLKVSSVQTVEKIVEKIVEVIVEVPVPNTTTEAVLNRTIDYLETDVDTLGQYALYGCKSLTTVKALNLRELGYGALSDCSNLTSIEAPYLTKVSDNALRNTAIAGAIDWPYVTSIGGSALSYAAITSINAPLVETLGDYALSYTLIKRFDGPNVRSLGGYVFSQCKNLEEVFLPMCRNFSTQPFNYCTALKRIELGCPELPSSGQLGVGMFNNMSADVFLKATFTFKLRQNPSNFTGRVFVPADLVASYKAAQYWSTIADKIFSIDDYVPLEPSTPGDSGVTDGPGLMEGAGTTEETSTYEYSRFVGYDYYVYVPDGSETETDNTEAGSGSTDSGSTDSGSTDSGSTGSGSTGSGSTGSGSTGSGPTNPGIIIDPGMSGGPGLM